MTKIFILGGTGYIGGDALHAIITAHPDYDITALVRNSDKGAKVAAAYPNVKLVYGDLDSGELLEEKAQNADIVCNFANADHSAAVKSLLAGLARRPAETPGFLIHTSGTGILMFPDTDAGTLGTTIREKVYDDLRDIAEITSLPEHASHRQIDKLVLGAAASALKHLHTAIVCPPCIYGAGRGPDARRSVQVPGLVKATLQHGHGVQVNEGKAYWSNVHVHDLSGLFLGLVEEAAAGGMTTDWSGKPATWGKEGYYFAENGESLWGELSVSVAKEAKRQGWIGSDEVKSLSAAEAKALDGYSDRLWGANSRSRASRAREVLKWKPSGAALVDEIAATVEAEAKALGLQKGHAAVAAGEA